MITALKMHNCGPFKGDHAITLGEGAYAIVARHEDDASQSNGIGKSFVLEMINFAITGRFSKSRDYNADDWITRGESSATVSVTFEDGSYISRSKKRGQSTQVRFVRAGAGEAAQDAAHDAVLKYIAMDPDDFVNASYFEQRKMARLVDPDQTKPSARLDIVSGWFGLGLAERAEERAGEIASEHERELTKLTNRREALGEAIADDETDIAREEALLEALIEVQKDLREEKKEADRIDYHRNVVDGQVKRIQDVTRMMREIDNAGDVDHLAHAAEEEIAGLQGVRANQVVAVKQKKNVSLGMFDGACPVAQIICPARDQINANRTAAVKALEEARSALEESEEAIEEAKEKHAPMLAKRRTLDTLRKELDDVRRLVRENAEQTKQSKSYLATARPLAAKYASLLDYEKAFNDRTESVRDEIEQHRTKIALARAARAAAEKKHIEVHHLDAQIVDRRKLVSQHLKARAIFRHAQRRVAERNLSFVEGEANYQLSEAGIDLRVSARWSREANGPAKTCDECGHAFPTSAKVKTCERCGAERGQHTVQRLDFMLSDRSGALNDLGGVAMQLAAGAWLLSARQSPFSTAMLDEPFAACDAKNRRALALQLVKLIARGTYRQAMVISHSPDTVEVYPHKIVITQKRDGSRVISTT